MGLVVPDSHSNFVFAQVKTGSAARIHEQLAQRNIFIRYWNAPGISDKLRISVGTKEQNARLLAALREMLAQ